MINFNISEFDSPDKKGSGKFMDKTFLSMIDEARSVAKVPFVISSGYRTKKYNEKLKQQGYKAVKNSSHLKGLAADIRVVDSSHRYLIINALLDVGFTRIGIAKTFIHCDCDLDKAQHVTWVY